MILKLGGIGGWGVFMCISRTQQERPIDGMILLLDPFTTLPLDQSQSQRPLHCEEQLVVALPASHPSTLFGFVSSLIAKGWS